MSLNRYTLAVALACLLFVGLQGVADAIYSAGGRVVIPGAPAASTDIIWVDSSAGRGYLADRSNTSIDVFNTRTISFTGTISTAPTTANGVAVDASHNVIWGGTNSTINIASSATLTNISSMSTGGTGRADELAIAGGTFNEVLIANDQNVPPFVSLFSYNPATGTLTANLGMLSLPQATAGIEQPIWDPAQKEFFEAIPSFNGKPAVIGILPTSPPTLSQVYSLTTCTGATGLSLGPNEEFFVGCAPNPVIINGTTGAVLATLTAALNPDENWFNPGNNEFMNVSNTAGGQSLTTFSAAPPFGLIDNIIVGPNHNLAADSGNNAAFVFLRVGNQTCPTTGCIQSFSFAPPVGGGSGGFIPPVLPGSGENGPVAGGGGGGGGGRPIVPFGGEH